MSSYEVISDTNGSMDNVSNSPPGILKACKSVCKSDDNEHEGNNKEGIGVCKSKKSLTIQHDRKNLKAIKINKPAL